jgi:SpoVK/Ycf46/Vps4 family AAA+-type ATPase
VVLLIFCCYLIHRNEETLQIRALKDVFGYRETSAIQRRFKSREHKLFVNGLVEFDCQMGMADTEHYRLSKKAKDEFLADFDLKENSSRRGKDIIQSKDISGKNLYYNEKIKGRIKELTGLLREENFLNVQKRLGENNMRTGFPCIFSGPPGTGKTETVYQIARDTGRDIMLVDIAESKSMWFGESEKLIKAVFDRYRGMVKGGGPAPRLLFNEADAILGKRRELPQARSGPGQTENAIQNIILQEMENLNGILIATTNLTINLDKAFERRFLYKIEFDKPDTASKKLMWQNMIPVISDEDALHLAAKFDLSGGQIENISRRRTVEFVLSGTEPSLDQLITMCREEQLHKETAFRIGFTVE